MLLIEKKCTILKVENCVLFSRFSEDLSLEDSLSDSSEGLFQRSKGGKRIYRGFTRKNKWPEHQKTTVKENQTFQTNSFSVFLLMGRCQSLGLLKSFL